MNERNAIVAGGQAAGIVPSTFEECQRIAGALVSAGIGSYKYNADREEKIAIATAQIMTGLEVGVAPMQAMGNIAVINGRPMIWGELAVALVLRAGCTYNVWTEGEGDNLKAIATLKRPDGREFRREFTKRQAVQARLWDERPKVQRRGKNNTSYTADNDSPWFLYPEDMLGWKATARLFRTGAADILKGISIREDMSPEPVNGGDITPATVTVADMPDPDPPKAKAKRASGPATIDDMPDPDAPPAEPFDPEIEWEGDENAFMTALSEKIEAAKPDEAKLKAIRQANQTMILNLDDQKQHIVNIWLAGEPIEAPDEADADFAEVD